MKNILFVIAGLTFTYFPADSKECEIVCPETDSELACGLNLSNNTYKMFPNLCALTAYAECNDVDVVATPLKYCVKYVGMITRRRYYEEESCPLFCPSHYRPSCGASKLKSYAYKSFTNHCFMEMLNCRGSDEDSGYVEVPLEFCQNHAMKNIYKEKVVVSNMGNDFEYY